MRLFCKHEYEIVACYRGTQQVLLRCKKCGKYYNFHHGINCGYAMKDKEVEEIKNKVIWLPKNCTEKEFENIRLETLY